MSCPSCLPAGCVGATSLVSPPGFTLTLSFFFFNDTATTEIYTLSLHDALPISSSKRCAATGSLRSGAWRRTSSCRSRSEEHTSELQSRPHLVCRLLLEKKKTETDINYEISLTILTGSC